MQNKAIIFLTTDEVVEIHKRLIERFGGADGIRDLGLLESALYRPRTGYYSDLIQMSAAMFESLINNHPFVDGNKRVAIFSTDIFLRINGYKMMLDPYEAYSFLMKLFEDKTCSMQMLEPWIRTNTVEL